MMVLMEGAMEVDGREKVGSWSRKRLKRLKEDFEC
jgi:hypothetical protein